MCVLDDSFLFIFISAFIARRVGRRVLLYEIAIHNVVPSDEVFYCSNLPRQSLVTAVSKGNGDACALIGFSHL